MHNVDDLQLVPYMCVPVYSYVAVPEAVFALPSTSYTSHIVCRKHLQALSLLNHCVQIQDLGFLGTEYGTNACSSQH